MDLVIGATGRVGSAAAGALLAMKRPVQFQQMPLAASCELIGRDPTTLSQFARGSRGDT